MKLGWIAPLVAAAMALPLLSSDDARACGGCFVSQSESTVVTGHRMAVSVSPTQSVLWDQIRYSGDPKEFAWVLPIKPGARIELAADAWFEALDGATTVQIASPQLSCGGSGSGCGSFGAASDEDSGGLAARGKDVTVVHEGTVGPYETVTLATDKAGALNTWLDEHGYGVDESTQPVIDAYVAEGFDFIALRLLPTSGVKDMKPVRVVTVGASPTLPLRMVAAGTGPEVSVILFVIGEGRWAAKNFANPSLPRDLLAWDFETQSSNYAELRKAVLASHDGASFMTPYAQKGTLLSPFAGDGGFFGRQYVTSSGAPTETIGAAFVQQALDNGETTDTSCLAGMTGVANSASLVVDPCPAGAKPTDPACGMAGGTDIDRRSLMCGQQDQVPLDDLAVALTGMHPKDVWVTRLEANLPHAALAQDLELEPAAHQDPVDNQLRARASIHPDAACPSGVMPIVGPERGGRDRGLYLGVALMGLAMAAALTRRRGWALARR